MKKTGALPWLVAALLAVLGGCTRSEQDSSLSLFHWDFELDKGGAIYQRIRDRLEVDIVPLTAPWSEWPNKLNVMIAAGDVPDVFVTYGPGDPDSFERLAADGLLVPLAPYLERYPNLARRLEGREDQELEGHFYALPVALPKSDHIGMIRGDWLDELGLPVPQTVEELYRTARAFKEAYGIYPISSSPAHTAGFFWLNFLFYAFGGGWDTWLRNEDDSYVMCWVSEGNRRGLQFTGRLYREGLLDPEFFSNSDAQKMDRFLSGRAGIVFHNGVSQYADRLRALDPQACLELFSPVAGPGGERGQWAMDGFFTAVSIHSRIPEARRDKALELLDYLCSPEGLELLRYGVEGVHWAMQDGRQVPLLPEEADGYRRLREVDPSASLRDFVELGDIWVPEWDPNHELVTRAVGSGERYGQVPLFLYDKTEAEKRYRKTLTDMVFQEYVRLVQSEDFDTEWEAFVQRWYAAGGEAMTRERNGR